MKTKLSSLFVWKDTLAQFLVTDGKKGNLGQMSRPAGQGGLVHIIDEWITEQVDMPVDIKQHVEEIIDHEDTKRVGYI